MLATPMRVPLERIVQVALALTILAFACGTSGIAEIQQRAFQLRWPALAVLGVLALALAARRHPLARPSLTVYGLGAFLAALAVVSAAWSPHARLTIGRGGTFVVAVVTAGALGLAAAGRPRLARQLVAAVVAAATAVAAAGFVVLAWDPELALQAGTVDMPVRLQGFGMNPNTPALLYAVALPPAVWLAASAASRGAAAASWGAVGAMAVSLFWSGSRGATVASFVGIAFVILVIGGRPLRRLALTAATAVVYVAGVVAADMRSLQPEFAEAVKPRAIAPADANVPGARGSGGGSGGGRDGTSGGGSGGSGSSGETSGERIEVEPGTFVLPPNYPLPRERLKGPLPFVLEHNVTDVYEVGVERPPGIFQPRQTGIFRGSGRIAVWYGALQQALRRPIVGFGFGLEEIVFDDRYYAFEGNRPENSYIGWLLQLGLVGCAVFVAIGIATAAAVVRGVRTGVAAAAAGGALGGFAVALMQSYVYSVGSIATLAVWVLVALAVAGAAHPPEARPAPVRVRRADPEPVEALV